MLIYQFVAPHPYDESLSHIEKTIISIGGRIKSKDIERGRMICGVGFSNRIEFFVEPGETSCNCRALLHGSGQLWNKFIVALGEDWGMEACSFKSPLYVKDLLYIGDDISKAGVSVNISNRITYYKESRSSFKKTVMVRLLYSDGHIAEQEISKTSPLYQELMVRFGDKIT